MNPAVRAVEQHDADSRTEEREYPAGIFPSWPQEKADQVLAYKSQVAPGNCQYASSEDWAENVVDQARRLKADGAIFNNNWGCKQASGLGTIVRDELLRNCNVPSVTLNVDVIDSTFVTRAEIESQLDSFFEMIETSKVYKERRSLQ